jgi:hypothetical protein
MQGDLPDINAKFQNTPRADSIWDVASGSQKSKIMDKETVETTIESLFR